MSKIKSPQDYPDHGDKLLPDWFKFGYYEDMAKIKDFSFWAFQFAIRSEYKNKDAFLADTGGTVTNDDGVKLSWKNGVYYSHSPEHLKQYIDGYKIHYLKKYKGKLIPDNDFKPDPVIIKNILNALNYEDGFQLMRPHAKIITTHDSPLKSLYQKVFNQLAKHEFPDKESYENYRVSTGRINHTTASFLVNLKMPTSRIIKELETQIEQLKRQRRIVEYKAMKNPKPLEWSQALAVWDLWEADIKPRVIQNRVLAKWHEGFTPLEIDVFEKSLQSMYEHRKDIAQKIIGKDWKKLSGQLDLDP